MRYLKVNLWGHEIGRLIWDVSSRRAYFIYNPEDKAEIPDIAPLSSPARLRNIMLPIYGDDRPLYQGLPPFIADSLPDSWGNTLFDKWVRDNKLPRNRVTPLYKLMFIGTRGMGALEYEPCASELSHIQPLDIRALHDLSLKILADRADVALTGNEKLTLQGLLAVGTSAGGRQMKAIVAINDRTGEIRSGQTDGLDGFDYHILKFGDISMPIAEIEMTYYSMAVDAGINMKECRLISVEGVNHFLTKRFDRKDGRKIHTQTLAAINPEAGSYEDLVATCREISLPENEIEQLFARMVFNIMANNTDDHNKNFSFMLEDGGSWHLAPAYDMTFIFNVNGTGPNLARRLSINGKTVGISKADLLDFASQNDIRNALEIIDRVAASISHFDKYAEGCGIGQPWRGIIRKTLYDTLSSFGYIADGEDKTKSLSDRYGREISEFAVTVNSKGFYEVTAFIDGHRHRRFIKPGMFLYDDLSDNDIFALSPDEKLRFVEAIFPPGKP